MKPFQPKGEKGHKQTLPRRRRYTEKNFVPLCLRGLLDWGRTRQISHLGFIFHLSSFVLLISFLLHPSSFASAETTAYVQIGAPDVSKFPTISATLDVYNPDGQFVSGLKPKDVMVVEDGASRPVQKLTEFPVGAQIVVALNPGPALDVRDGNGVTRYEKIQQNLTVWAQALPLEDGDALSLVTFAGPIIAHTDPGSWVASLASFQPNFKATTPNIQSLSLAVEVASSSAQAVGMKRAVLFITPHMEDLGIEGALTEIAQRAVTNRVRIFVWLVDNEVFFGDASVGFFQNLAAQTGGEFITYDGRGELPDPETYFAPLRKAYTLTYESALAKTGEHTLTAEATLGEVRIASLPQTFTLNVQAPNPIFDAPPALITRQPPADDPYNKEILDPTEQAIAIIFDFPDGYPRPIKRAVLYVDGQPVAENTSGALDRFTWDISAYVESGRHMLKVEATDSLGLTGTSLDTPVDIKVVRPVRTLGVIIAENRTVIVGAAVGVAGIILVGILLSSLGRFRSRRARRAERQRFADPVTQPVSIAVTEPPTGPSKSSKRPRPVRGLTEAPAWLTRLAPDGQAAPGSPIPLLGPEVKLGSSPTLADVVLDETILAPLHAKIQQNESGYAIFDQNSIAGTWVNYEAVTREGHPLKHGDRVHLGNLSYRFELKNPPPTPEPTITPADP